MSLRELVRQHREEILQIAARYGARDLRLFGSAARGDEVPESDIDVLVNLEPGRSLFDLGGLLMDLENLLGRRVDVVTEKGLKPRIKDRVLHEAVPI